MMQRRRKRRDDGAVGHVRQQQQKQCETTSRTTTTKKKLVATPPPSLDWCGHRDRFLATAALVNSFLLLFVICKEEGVVWSSCDKDRSHAVSKRTKSYYHSERRIMEDEEQHYL
jgi:hypothetical protein